MTTPNLTIDPNDIEASFARVANELMNHFVITSGAKSFRIAEIEFYFSEITGTHNDNYTHGHDLQLTTGNWYQHGSGLDITIGNQHAYGGILIRALQEINQEGKEIRYIYGPLNCLQSLFTEFGHITKHQIAFGIERAGLGVLEPEKVIAAPRVGLNPQKQPEMIDKLYRFLILPKQKHAEKTKIYDAMEKQGFSDAERRAIWG